MSLKGKTKEAGSKRSAFDTKICTTPGRQTRSIAESEGGVKHLAMQKYQPRSLRAGASSEKLREITAEKFEFMAVQLRALLPIASEVEHPRLHHHVSTAYMIAYRAAAEMREPETGKKSADK